MTIAIIDDEAINRLVVKKIIQRHCPDLEIIVEEGLINEAINKINEHKPDVIFLDIELKNGTGFDILNQLLYKPKVIFTTAYSEYALQALKLHAFDYVLKPIDEQELVESVKRLKELYKLTSGNERKAETGMFSYTTNSGKSIINIRDIIYFESSGSYTFLYTINEKIILSKNIGEIEKDIDATLFFRTHHSYLVNTTKIKSIDVKRSGEVTLLNDDKVPISQRKVKDFLMVMEDKKVNSSQ